jgi:hypothetical protein
VPDALAPPANTPCNNCEYLSGCSAYSALRALVYTKPGFLKPEMTAKFLGAAKAKVVLDLLPQCVAAWLATVERADLEAELKDVSLAALFDVLMTGLYGTVVFEDARGPIGRQAFVHGGDETWGYFPYIWMCPACVAQGASPGDAYLPGATLKADQRMYSVKERLARPEGRMIGDFGALCIRTIIGAITTPGAHFAAGGGHRGEFDLIIATEDMLILGETKASPLVAFPLAARLPTEADHHTWVDAGDATHWALFLGAAPEGERFLPLSPPSGSAWPLTDVLHFASDPSTVETILRAWKRHLEGYRKFNEEDPHTRWHRFGCGNIEVKNPAPGHAKQLRVDNTKILPGLDRTDDIKKGIAQVMLFGRLKIGCRMRAVKTVLFGNLYAETHHEHYVKPLASLELLWPGNEPVWLLDGIVALSRNILNDARLSALFGLPSEPYPTDETSTHELLAVAEGAADAGNGDEP